MHPKLDALRSAATAAWSSTPGSRPRVWAVWATGLALGAALFAAALLLPPYAAALLWFAFLGAGLLLALLDMAPIQGGLFRMGSPPATEGEIQEYAAQWAKAFGGKQDQHKLNVRRWRQQEEPAHQVRLSPFSIARTPVTRGQWRSVMPNAPEEWKQDGSDTDLPATHVDWSQALAFCNTLSKREGLTPCYQKDDKDQWHWDPSAEGYRLPTEAEWEYTCRAGTTERWFWGDRPEGADTHAWYSGNAERRLHRVAEKTANPWDLHDMAGLVYEWCWDRFGDYPNETDPPPMDSTGPEVGDNRVVRGGSFENPPGVLRSAVRFDVRSVFRDDRLGLRCVRSRVRQP